jgi:Na+-translocating ferredoxin:NAD+ oxidoreductase RnfE subunit
MPLQELVEMAISLGFKRLPISCFGFEGVPLELQVLGVLRVLGRGTCFDGIAELTGASEESHRRFFHSFCSKFAER